MYQKAVGRCHGHFDGLELHLLRKLCDEQYKDLFQPGLCRFGQPVRQAGQTGGRPLAAPQDFRVGADGSYSFTGSEGAEYYLLYFCAPDATSDNDSFLYSSSPINEDGSGTYTGQCSDLFDYAYGEYLVKVFAFPDITSEDYSMSTAASASYTYSGEQRPQDHLLLEYL